MKDRFYIKTWGCQMNLHQSEAIAGILESAGYTQASSLQDADIVLFNTCSVRQKAEEKVYGQFGQIKALKDQRDLVFGLGGCMAHIHRGKLLDRFPLIDFLFATTDLLSLPALLSNAKKRKARIVQIPSPSLVQEVPYSRQSRVTAMVTITEGCSNFCSYCIVPYARGPLRSRQPDLILSEVEDLADSGYKEICLLGQNVDSYGRDRPAYGDFADLLAAIAGTGIPRIRFTSSHPRDMTQRVIDTVADNPNVCNHIHLACQSGSDRILAHMNRGYTSDDFLSIVKRARDTVPGINITTDLIVGYPGETRSDFGATMRLVREAGFGSIFVAKYSPRPGTRSAEFEDDVPDSVKASRLQKVLEAQREIALSRNRESIGKTYSVLVEGRTQGRRLFGRADDHRTVTFAGNAKLGEFIQVRVDNATAAALSGRTVTAATTRGAT